MAISTQLSDLSVTAASNPPASTDTISTGDDQMRALGSIVRRISVGTDALETPALGTPASGVLTNATGLPVSTGISGLGTGVATFLATPTSANLASAITNETGSGSLVFATSPTLVTPTLGVATATSINKVAFTAPATSATLALVDGTTVTGPAATGTLSTLAGTEELTNKTLNASVGKGTWTASGTWTLPAFTLGGAITGNSQNISGLGTLGCGAITSSGAISGTTGTFSTGLDGLIVGSGSTTNAGWKFGYYGSSGVSAIWPTSVAGAQNGVDYAYAASSSTTFVNAPTSIKLQTGSTDRLTLSSTALTLGSGITSISGGTNPSLNIGSGSLTAGASGFGIAPTAGRVEIALSNTAAQQLRISHSTLPASYYAGYSEKGDLTVERTTWSAGVGVDFTTTSGTSTWSDTQSGNFVFKPRGVEAARISSTGLSLGSLGLTAGTGTFSGTGNNNVTVSSGATHYAQFQGYTGNGSAGNVNYVMLANKTGSAYLGIPNNAVGLDVVYGDSYSVCIAETERTRVTSTGLAVTGVLQSTRPADNTQYCKVYSDSGVMYLDAVNSNVGTRQSIEFRQGNNVNTTTSMTLDASGNLLVNRTANIDVGRMCMAYPGTSQHGFEINDADSINTSQFIAFYTGGTSRGSISNNNNTGVSYNTSSDYRLKENIQDLTNSGAFIDALQPRTWDWKSNGEKGTGFIAHELQEVSPSSVTGTKDETQTKRVEVSPATPAVLDEEGNEITPAVEAVYEDQIVPKYQSVEYGSAEVIAMLVAEVKSLRTRLAALESA